VILSKDSYIFNILPMNNDLFYNSWHSQVKNLFDCSRYSDQFLSEFYQMGKTPQDAYDELFYLPF
jgi:hypothetical protein